MMKTTCLFCKKEYTIDQGDPYYRKLKNQETKYYVCKKCNQSSKEEAIKTTGIIPDMIDPDKYDKYLP